MDSYLLDGYRERTGDSGYENSDLRLRALIWKQNAEADQMNFLNNSAEGIYIFETTGEYLYSQADFEANQQAYDLQIKQAQTIRGNGESVGFFEFAGDFSKEVGKNLGKVGKNVTESTTYILEATKEAAKKAKDLAESPLFPLYAAGFVIVLIVVLKKV